MAIVSISRIQVRRGKKNTSTGFPQLASGEFGWAIDTQELYIGNGSVSEGSPYVGNTKLLSEHDDIFALANNYTYRDGTFIQTGDTENSPIQRTLQDRLDDRVSIRSFGATGDGSDQTAALQRAIDQLFLNTDKLNPRARQVLHIEAGTYNISDTIYLPPYTVIKGAGEGKTVITKTNSGAAFKTINSSSTPGSYANDTTEANATTTENQAQYIELSGLSINTTASSDQGIILQNCKNSTFRDITITGSFSNGDSSYSENDVGIQMTIVGTLGSAGTSDNYFENINIKNYSYAVQSKFDVENNLWHKCKFNNVGYGFEFGAGSNLASSGERTGPSNNTISMSEFNDIDRHGIWISNGENNLSSGNRFILVGNNGGNENLAEYAVINFVKVGNISKNDYFGRTESLSYNQGFLTESYIPEVSGETFVDQDYVNKISLVQYTDPVVVLRLPVENKKAFRLEYMYISNTTNGMRQGTMSLVINPDTAEDPAGQISLVDDYDFVGDPLIDEYLKFSAELKSYNDAGTLDTLEMSVLNLNNDGSTSDSAEFYWTVHTKIG